MSNEPTPGEASSLQLFATLTLRTLTDHEVWSADTINEISSLALALELAVTNDDGMFEAVVG